MAKSEKKKDIRSLVFDRLKVADDAAWIDEVIQSGIITLDHAMCGGFPQGRIIELFGPPGMAKSTIGSLVLAATQQRGGLAVLLDLESAFNLPFYISLGGSADLQIADARQVRCVEDVFDFILRFCEFLIETRPPGPYALLWDGVAATTTKHLVETELDKADLTKALKIAQGLSLILGPVAEAGLCLMFTNQTRDKIVAGQVSKDSATHTPGGRALKFATSQRIELASSGGTTTSAIFDEKTGLQIGRLLLGSIEKSRLGSPWTRFVLPMYTRDGFPHPKFNCRTRVGIDVEESLLYYYQNGSYFVNEDHDRVITKDKQGWCTLHESIDPSGKKFHEADWLEKLEQFPQLRTLLYDDLELNPESIVTTKQ